MQATIHIAQPKQPVTLFLQSQPPEPPKWRQRLYSCYINMYSLLVLLAEEKHTQFKEFQVKMIGYKSSEYLKD